MSEGHELAAGKHVTPNVRLVAPLGQGGMGAVWLADHTRLNTRVVVKFMLDDLDGSASARLRFSREAEAAAQVKSPHVVQMYDHGVTDDGVPFIVMEHLEGRDLAAVLAERGGPLEPSEVITIVAQLAKALTKVHAAGLLHRDIKPDNVFVVDGEEELFVKLLDFGIAKSHSSESEGSMSGETKTGQVVGTPFYMSPEQVTAQKTIDARSDLWAVAVVTFELLTGQRPFDGPSFGALAVKIATGTPPVPSEVNPALPAAFDAWFARGCARDPSERFPTARALADALRASFEGVVSLPRSALVSDSGDRLRSDSGDRGKVPSTLGLAATVNQTETPAEGAPASSLGRSEPGSVVVRSQATDPRRGPWMAIGIVAILAMGAGAFLAVTRGGSSGKGAAGSVDEPTQKSAGRIAEGPLLAPPPPASAAPPAVAASSAPSASAAPSASVPPRHTPHVKSDVKPGAPSTKGQGGHDTPPPPKASSGPSHDDPLF